MRLYNKLLAFSVAAIMVFALAACGGSSTPTPSAAPAASATPAAPTASETPAEEGEIVIGFIGPLTGGLAAYGDTAMKGASLYLEEVGQVLNRPIKFVPLDDKGDITDAVNNYNRLVNNDNAVAIIGAVTSGPSASIATASQRDGIPIISPSATALDVTSYGSNMFRACFIDPFQGEVMANYSTNRLTAKTAAVIYNNGSDYSVGLYESFVDTFRKNGGEVVAEEAYADGDVDFKSQLTKIAATNPEVLFIPDYYGTVALIAKQAKDIGLKSVFLGADGWDGVLGVVEDASVINGSFFCGHYSNDDPDPMVQSFVQSYKSKYNEDPNAFSALGYDAAKIMMAAIEKAGTTDSAAIVDALQNTDVTVLTGNVKFDENRNPIKGVAIMQIIEGENVMTEKLNP